MTETPDERAARFAELGVDADDVLGALERIVLADLPAQLARVNARKGVALTMPAVLEQLPDPSTLADATAQYPALAFTSPGLADTPVRMGGGRYTLAWTCLVTVVLRGSTGTYRDTARDTRLYVAAIRAVIARNRTLHVDGLPGFARDAEFVGEDYAAYDSPSSARTLGAGFVEFTITVEDALVDAPLLPDWPVATVETTDFDATPADPEGLTP